MTSEEIDREFRARPNRIVRVLVGVFGVTLPTMLFLLDWLFLRRPASFRGSLSAYYHSPARDWFVANLFVTGVLLVTYFAGERRTRDFWISSVAGVAAWGVAFFPTMRPDPEAADLTQLQFALGEKAVAAVHYASACLFILGLAFICFFVYASREENSRLARVHRGCGGLILLGVAWAILGEAFNVPFQTFTPLYVGEVVSVYSFGVSWLVMARKIR